MSNHPLNQYKSIFGLYNITDYQDFEINKDILSSNIACTVLKVQEKKTQKGNSYGIVKFKLVDGRKKSKSFNKEDNITMSTKKHSVLVIPPGVWFCFTTELKKSVILNLDIY